MPAAVATAMMVDWPAFAAPRRGRGVLHPQHYCDAASMDYLPYRVRRPHALLRLMSRFAGDLFPYGRVRSLRPRQLGRPRYPARLGATERCCASALQRGRAQLVDLRVRREPGGSLRLRHPAGDLARLKAKTDSMIRPRVRHFALFLDDIPTIRRRPGAAHQRLRRLRSEAKLLEST